MGSFRKVLGLFVLGVMLALAALPALAHSGAQSPINAPNNFTPGHDRDEPNGTVGDRLLN